MRYGDKTPPNVKAQLSNSRRCGKDGKGHRAQQGHKASKMLIGLETPCFNFKYCKGMATLAKGGKAVCRPCADKMSGVEYLYETPRTDAIGRIRSQLNMVGVWPVV